MSRAIQTRGPRFGRKTRLAGMFGVVLLAACGAGAGKAPQAIRNPTTTLSSAPSPSPATSASVLSFERIEVYGGLSLLLPDSAGFRAAEPRGAFRGVANERRGIEVWFREARVARTTKLSECEREMSQSFSLLRDAGEVAVEERLDRPEGFVGKRTLRLGAGGQYVVALFSLESRRCTAVVLAVRGAEAPQLATEIFDTSLPSVVLEEPEARFRRSVGPPF